MQTKPALVLISIVAVAVGACTGSTAAPSTTAAAAPTAAATQVAVATLIASAVPAATSAASSAPSGEPAASSGGGPAGPSAPPSAIDPCSLLTAREASGTIGTKLGAGVSTLVDHNRVCTFKSGLTELKVILAPRAPDSATAQGYWDAERARIAGDVPLKILTSFDRSAYGATSAGGTSLSALFVLDGLNAFDLFCAHPACGQGSSIGAAELIVGRFH
jgi:hypothetical protein